ncbi:MAG: hypothetical protein ABSB73_12485 [Solirubrobacteraceae bacterium]
MTNSSLSTDAVDLLACEVLADLYRAYCGTPPLAVRAYRDEEALLLLLRFDPDTTDDPSGEGDPLVAVALHAMPSRPRQPVAVLRPRPRRLRVQRAG